MKDKEELIPITHKIVIVIASIFILATPFLLSLNNPWFSLNDPSLANIGTALSITTPFIGIGGSILVYMAFRVQFRANDEISKQFKQQNLDQIFFRLIDAMNNKIEISNVQVVDETRSGLQAFHQIIKVFHREIGYRTSEVGKNIVLKHPELVENQYRTTFITSLHFTGNIEFLDIVIIAKGGSFENHDKELYANTLISDIGKSFFYHSDFNFRKEIYEKTYEDMYKKYGGIIENYIVTVQSLLKFVYTNSSSGKSFYLDFITDNLTGIERTLIFYYCASQHAKKEFKKHIVHSKILYNLDIFSFHLRKVDSNDVLHQEINLVLGVK